MAQYQLTPKARDGLHSVITYVADTFGEEVASQVLDRLEKSFERVAENPLIGHRREDLTSNAQVLFWPVGPTLLAYRPTEGGVEILVVERGEQDWEEILARSLP